jgi:hypothetical protein
VALWQFITFTVLISVLIGAILVYASIIARRLGCANARLHEIEEALNAMDRRVYSPDTAATEPKSEVSGGLHGRGRLLTIGDLRQMSSGAARSSGPTSVVGSEARGASNTPRGPMKLPSTTPIGRGGSVAIGSESSEALRACGEELSSPGASALTGNSVPPILASRAAPLASSELLSVLTLDAGDSVATTSAILDTGATNCDRKCPPPSHCPPSDDSAARKERDMALFLSNQRRRRRARLGY